MASGNDVTSAPITADPRHPSRLYAAGSTVTQQAAEGEPFHGPAFFTASRNSGRTWSPARVVVAPGPRPNHHGASAQRAAGGVLLGTVTHIDLQARPPRTRRGRHALMAIRSADRGPTWTPPATVAGLRSTVSTTRKTPGDAVARGGRMVAHNAVHPVTGRVYLVCQDARFTSRHADGVDLLIRGRSRHLDPARPGERHPRHAARTEPAGVHPERSRWPSPAPTSATTPRTPRSSRTGGRRRARRGATRRPGCGGRRG
ncbi:sialidase family protein [Sinosporangium siamense]|uniref:sialidase family protein n=1 Tax=Sinosporangium siamense TaxID=1367973 RepID=UPI0035F02249